jgi:transcriptional regulator of arginine metabolism
MKPPRHASILDVVRTERIHSQERLRELLIERGFDVAQATLSRDIRDLGLVKVPDEEQGGSVYMSPSTADPAPVLARMLPALYTSADGVGNLLVLRTMVGGAQPVAAAIDGARWPEVVGTIAGDDTILLILRAPEHLDLVRERVEALAGIRT